jgi:hypothetical protein
MQLKTVEPSQSCCAKPAGIAANHFAFSKVENPAWFMSASAVSLKKAVQNSEGSKIFYKYYGLFVKQAVFYFSEYNNLPNH